MNIRYEIETTLIKPFTYRPPLVEVTDNGELNLRYSKKNNSYTFIKQITFLNLAGRSDQGNIISFEPLDYVNQFLLAHHIDDNREESEQLSKALVHYLTYLIALQEQWDDEYEQDLYEEGIDEPRPKWDYFTSIKSERITYRYRRELRDSVLNSKDGLARTTASNYMRAITKFYRYYLRKKHIFNNPPFENEIIKLHLNSGGTSMKPYMTQDIHTTDLRLNFPKSKRNDGGVIEEFRRDLRPLSNSEWNAVEGILTKSNKKRKWSKKDG
jgi:hypothetical protein